MHALKLNKPAKAQQHVRDFIERALAHAVANKVEAAYHGTALLEQRRPMMLAWVECVPNGRITSR